MFKNPSLLPDPLNANIYTEFINNIYEKAEQDKSITMNDNNISPKDKLKRFQVISKTLDDNLCLVARNGNKRALVDRNIVASNQVLSSKEYSENFHHTDEFYSSEVYIKAKNLLIDTNKEILNLHIKGFKNDNSFT